MNGERGRGGGGGRRRRRSGGRRGAGAAGGSRARGGEPAARDGEGRGGEPVARDGEGRGGEPVASDGEGLADRGNAKQERLDLGGCSGQQVQGRHGDAGSGSGALPLQPVHSNVGGGGGRGRATEVAVGDGDGGGDGEGRGDEPVDSDGEGRATEATVGDGDGGRATEAAVGDGGLGRRGHNGDADSGHRERGSGAPPNEGGQGGLETNVGGGGGRGRAVATRAPVSDGDGGHSSTVNGEAARGGVQGRNRGGGGSDEPSGVLDADADAGGGNEGQDGGGGPVRRRGGRNGDVEQKRPDLGGPCVQPMHHGGHHGAGGPDASSPRDGTGLGEHNCNSDQENLGLGGLGGQQVQDEAEQLTGGSGGDGLGGAAATNRQSATCPVDKKGKLRAKRKRKLRAERRNRRRTKVKAALTGTPSILLPPSNFLTESVLSWTIKDVLNDKLYEKEAKDMPLQYDSITQFIDLHRILLVEETRASLCSALKNKYCPLLSVKQCESPSLFFIDIDLDMASSDIIGFHHIFEDFDACLLSSRPLLESNIDELYCSLAITIGVGRDTNFQKSFRVMVAKNKDFQPDKMRYVTFLENIKFSMEIACILSNEKDCKSVQAVLDLHKMVGKKCNTCVELCKDSIHTGNQKSASSLNCLHQNQADIVWTPPGTLKGCVAAVLKDFLHQNPKLKVLICVPNASCLSDILVDLQELSISPNTGDVLVLNNIRELENFCLEHQSHELFLCLTQCEGSLKGMYTLLNLDAYYHTQCGDAASSCARCNKSKLLKFSLRSFTRWFDTVMAFLEESLLYLKNHAASFSLVQETFKFEELLDSLGQIKVLLHNENLRVDYVESSLIPAVDVGSMDGASLVVSLNERRTTSIKLISGLLSSLDLPLPENRDILDRLCIKNSKIIVSTLDCTWKLHDVDMDPLDLTVICGAGQIKEIELLVPLLVPTGHTILFGDHCHLEPSINSKICKKSDYGVSIFKKLQQLVSRKEMLRHQYTMHPLINQFPNSYFYKGKVMDGANVRSSDYNREFIPLKLPSYAFLDVPAAKMRDIRKNYVYSAAILELLQQLCKDMLNTNRKFSIAVVCKSSTESNTVRDHLRSEKEIHDKILLQVKSIDSLKEESFDVIILSLFMEDQTNLKRVKENNLNVALTSSRHCLWIVGQQKVLNDSGGIWKSLFHNAKKRGCVQTMDIDKLAEVTKQFEDNSHCTNHNCVVSDKITCPPGQEFTWDGRPYRTKYPLANVRDQSGQPDTCTMHSSLGAAVSMWKLRNAGLEPPQEFKWDFILDDLKSQYEKIVSKEFRSEDKADRGNKRLETSLDISKKYGVLAINESGTKWRVFKILGWEYVDPANTEAVKKILEQGGIMVGHFRMSQNYYNLKPGQVYVYDKDQALLNPKSDQPASHAVMMIGIGRSKTVLDGYFRHMAMQSSEGRIFGINGLGRVAKTSVEGLYWIKVRKLERTSGGGA
ncbi:hypothetical protein EJB05_55850, partial [Eragrostis curvula]